VTAVAAGHHTCAVNITGGVVCWGRNYEGQTSVPPEAQTGVTAVAAGYYHTCALKTDGAVVCWGLSSYTSVPACTGAPLPHEHSAFAPTGRPPTRLRPLLMRSAIAHHRVSSGHDRLRADRSHAGPADLHR